ncbi:AMP-binding protein [Kitasatospora cathayae]|uniref:AMP-binding protein n=1 Tax=Kitasatospora cathayae TaxID=3004092 RepID=A0ABY7QE56_9ACTN|nr:AMP-binding protein [Kitasatospora sp. HUAS 3-15]WBP90980.1 AMP-binding protein [Kitasatospora sp. HUAS 3-15]
MVAPSAQEVATTDREFVSAPALILRSLASRPDRRAITTADGVEITAGDFAAATYRLAHELLARGISRGSTVTLLTGNTPEALSARYAAGLAGARVVNLYDGMSAPVLAEITASVDTTVLLVDAERYAHAAELLPLIDVPTVLTLGPGPDGTDRTDGTGPTGIGQDVIAASAHRPATEPAVPIGPEDHIGIRHTGGTTGIPKGILSLHGPYRSAFDAPFADPRPAGEQARLLAATSLAHLAGVLSDLTLHHGGSVVLHRSFDPGQVLAAIERERITDLWVLPPLLYQLLDHPALAQTDLSSLRRISYGGCAAAPTRIREALQAFGPVLVSGYGMSEAQNIAILGPHEHDRIGHGGQLSVGRPLPGVEVAIRSAVGTDLPRGEQGQIHVRSATLMAGYWKQPELTAQVLQGGWLNTGDIGYLDADGYLYLADRLKDLIIVVGGHVYPTEVEDLLLTHPAIAQCAVYGVRDDQQAEHVHVAVVPAQGQQPQLDEVRAFVTAKKGRIYAPEALHVVDAIPLTSVGKPDKKRLREAASNL